MAEEKKGLFGKKKPPPPPPRPQMGNMGVRIRLVEEKINNLNRKVETLETSALENYQKLTKEIRVLDDEFVGLKRSLDTVSQKMDLMVKELQRSAGKEEVRAIQKYLDLWNPTRFATRDEVDERLAELEGRPPPKKKSLPTPKSTQA